MLYRLCCLLSMTLISACSAVTIAPKPVSQAEPTTTEQRRFYAFGLVGDSDLSIETYCPIHDLEQLKAYRSAADSLLTAASLGLYAPMTVDIWCTALNKEGSQ